MSLREPTEPPPEPSASALGRAVRAMLSAKRYAHVRSVAETARRIASTGAWRHELVEAVERAAWIHDARREVRPDLLEHEIVSAGADPDPWARAHAPLLLHAQAAALWAAEQGVTDPEVLGAVRHHPTGSASWNVVGRVLYVADFCEPTRPFADAVDAAGLVTLAGRDRAGLLESARRVLRIRLAHALERGQPVHPEGWAAWNDWSGAGPA